MYSAYKKQLRQFYNYQTYIFRAVGVYSLPKDTSKRKQFAYKLYSGLIFFFTGGSNIAVLIEFFNQPTILDKIVNVVFVLITMMGSLFKQFTFKRNCALYQHQAALLYKDIFAPINSHEEAIFQGNLAINRRVRNSYGWLSVGSAIYVFLLQQIYHPGELAIALYCPFELNTSLRFIAMNSYGDIAIFILCLINVGFDSWCTSFLVFANTQLSILEHRLQRIGQNPTSDLSINDELKESIRHHAEIIVFMQKLEKTISLPVSIQIFCSLLALCCNFYSMSFTSVDDDISSFLKFFIYQMAMFAQIFFFCYFANEVTLTSLKLPHALYSSNWVAWSRENRKLMVLAIQRFQNPVLVRSINHCYTFSITTFTSIVNNSYRYFALLEQMNK